jgi:hypothetical protein
MIGTEDEAAALRKLRQYLVESIAYAADQIAQIDEQLKQLN